jgi:hypothetical protein
MLGEIEMSFYAASYVMLIATESFVVQVNGTVELIAALSEANVPVVLDNAQ